MDLKEKVSQIDVISFELMSNQFQYLSSLSENLNIREYLVIQYLGRKKSVIMSDLISIFATPPTTMTSIINGLVNKGYVKRRRRDDDRRVVEVILSEKGEKFFGANQKALYNNVEEVLANVSKEDINKLIELLYKVSNSIKKR